MNLKSDHKATSITNYQAIFTPCYHQDAFRIAIRSYDREGLGYFLLVDPDNFETSIVLKGDIQHRKQNVGPGEIGYYTQQAIKETPYGLGLDKVMSTSHPIQNDGITHAMRPCDAKQVFLTIDLCPSKRVFEEAFFKKLAAMGTAAGKPIPIAICITEFWRTLHQEEFAYLLKQQHIGTLDITWVNHSATHLYYHDRTSPEGLAENFLLDPRTNLTYELFEIEKALIMSGQLPSVFFRAPGLVTDKALIDKINSMGLITLGADAWLAKDQTPESGSIILVHGNSNEPAGIAPMMTYLEDDTFDFLPLQAAFPTPSEVPIYLAQMQAVKEGDGEETDDEAEKELARDTAACLPEAPLAWRKPPSAAPGTRVMTFAEAGQRLALFRQLKLKQYEVTQRRKRDADTVDLTVKLPTIS
ncbi:MAG: hypothetical protein NXI01_01400 [Gammaproteobacteria bacterium]|nr:hypothetical protein [Gammaproteobacteria bacterium]